MTFYQKCSKGSELLRTGRSIYQYVLFAKWRMRIVKRESDWKELLCNSSLIPLKTVGVIMKKLRFSSFLKERHLGRNRGALMMKPEASWSWNQVNCAGLWFWTLCLPVIRSTITDQLTNVPCVPHVHLGKHIYVLWKWQKIIFNRFYVDHFFFFTISLVVIATVVTWTDGSK